MIYLLSIFILITGLYLPMWAPVFVAFLFGLKMKNFSQASLCGFFSFFFIWIAAAYYFDMKSLGIVSRTLQDLFSFPSVVLTFLATGFLGGIIGLAATLCGFSLKRTLQFRI